MPIEVSGSSQSLKQILWTALSRVPRLPSLHFIFFFLFIGASAIWSLQPSVPILELSPSSLISSPAGPLYSPTTAIDFALGAFSNGSLPTGDEMIIDGGASKHTFEDVNVLDKITNSSPYHCVRVGDGSKLDVTAIGTAKIRVQTLTPIKRKSKTTY